MKKLKTGRSRERFGNLAYMLRNAWKFDKKNFLLYLLKIPSMVILPIVTGLTVKIMIDAIARGVSETEMFLIIGGIVFVIGLLTWIEPELDERARAVAANQTMLYRLTAFDKLMTMPFETLETPEGRKAFERSQTFIWDEGSGPSAFVQNLIRFVMSVIGGISYITIIGRINFYLILIMIAGGALQYLSLELILKKERALDKRTSGEALKNNYLFRISTDFAAAKDLRLYSFVPLFERLTQRVKRAYYRLVQQRYRVHNLYNILAAVLSLAVEACAFFFLLPQATDGRISVSDFIFYFGIATGFWAWVSGLVFSTYNLKKTADYCQYYRDFTEKNFVLSGSGKLPETVDEIRFENVSYIYPGKTEPAVKNMNLTVRRGERIAVVGENGAGKTTCMKLLCGLYTPTSGRILINGTDIADFGREAYFSLFAAVFQDHFILPMSIRENIALSRDSDPARVEDVAALAGLAPKIASLPAGVDTKLVKKLNNNAVDLSGGEKQKLLLARALYKDAPVLILDEPTAALDPIAENNIYLRYSELTQGKTSFFISHRLSSTRFCDRILFLSDGAVAEAGTHEELMRQKGGYQRMFDMQSFYYREGNAFGEEAAHA